MLYDTLVRRKMMRCAKQHPDADLLLSFDFSSSVADKVEIPTLLFCDWTIEYGCKYLNKHKPGRLEQASIEHQNRTIAQADYVVTLFPNVYDFMKPKFDNVHYLGNVINAAVEAPEMEKSDSLIADRYRNRKLLFIGRIAYKEALESLIQAMEQYNRDHSDMFTLDVIGIEAEQMGDYPGVTCHGYLNKDNERQKKLYYQLIKDAMFVVNTAEQWVGASSIIECAYFGLPFVVTPNADIIKTFGEKIDFGFYSENNSVAEVERQLEAVAGLGLEEYREMSIGAQKSVRDFAWDGYIKKIMELVKMKSVDREET